MRRPTYGEGASGVVPCEADGERRARGTGSAHAVIVVQVEDAVVAGVDAHLHRVVVRAAQACVWGWVSGF